MLVAEVHGKRRAEVDDDEDYLTSAVFGHLRYLPPSIFWERLFERARAADASGTPLARVLSNHGVNTSAYDSVEAGFWRDFPALGEPDVLLTFRSASQLPLVLLVEAKLWASKGSAGTADDQLLRYSRVLDDRRWFAGPFACPPVLVYLTPRNSQREIEESRDLTEGPDVWQQRMFRLQWQDVRAAALDAASSANEPYRTLLGDVADFLGRRQLRYFDGFGRGIDLSEFSTRGAFYGRPVTGRFKGMARLAIMQALTVTRGGWVR